MEFAHTLEIDAPVAEVWALTLDVEALPDISPTTMTSVERLDPGELVPGSRVRIKQPRQSARTWTVTRVDAPVRFEWETRFGPTRMIATHEIDAAGPGSRNTLRLALSGRGAGTLSRLLGGTFRRVLATENEGFRRVAEADRHTSGA